MHRRSAKPILAVICLLMAGAILAGCSGKNEELSKTEQADFKGGPMPESAKKIMQEKMQGAKSNAATGPAGIGGNAPK